MAIGRGRGGSLKRAFATLLIVAALLVYVGGKVTIMRLGYRIEALEREKRDLERANRSLRIEASSLAAPARIEELAAKRFGMIRPPKENIVVVKRKAATGQ
jgi:cell division protein FtsL